MTVSDPRALVSMPPDFKERVAFFRDAARGLALGSPCPVCEVPSGELCDPKIKNPETRNPYPLTPGGMHWLRYPKDKERIEGKNA